MTCTDPGTRFGTVGTVSNVLPVLGVHIAGARKSLISLWNIERTPNPPTKDPMNGNIFARSCTTPQRASDW